MAQQVSDNPLVEVVFSFRDGSGIRQRFDPPVTQGKAMAGLGRLVAELGGELHLSRCWLTKGNS